MMKRKLDAARIEEARRTTIKSDTTPIPLSRRRRVYCKQSAVLRAKRDIDFVMTISISPASQSAIIALNSSRLRVFVPVIPSSAYILTSSYVGWLAT